MSTITEQKAITPKLRFNGFEDNWHVKHLGELLEFKNGINASKEQYGHGIKFINVLDILNNEYITYDSIIGCVNVEENVASKYPVNYGDILFQRSSETREEVGTACVYLDRDKTAVFGGFVIRGKKIGEYDPIFLNKLLKTDISRNEITSKSGGSTRYNVGQETLSSVALNFPSLPEQQKIASFLSAMDEKIQQLRRKKELLEEYKNGVMKQLFSGKLRFKDENGKAFPKWDMVGGDKLFDSISDKKHNSDLPILAITQDHGAIPREMINYQMIVTDKSIASYKVVQVGDFIISLRTFQGGIEYSNYKGICSPAYNILRPSSNNVNRDFYKYYLKTSNYIMQLQKNLEGIRDGKMISYKYFSEIKLPFPSKEEQKKIANYLSDIDSKIEIVTKQLTQTQTFKKGLLQQMFV